MGQKSNILTVRKNLASISGISYNSKHIVQILSFINSFKHLLKRKGVWIVNQSVNFDGNSTKMNFNLFYTSSKISYLKRKNRVKKKIKFIFGVKKGISTVFRIFRLLRQNLFVLSLSNCNILITNRISVFLYNKLKRFGSVLFTRRYNLFIDFIKITSLFIENKVSVSFYLLILSQVFRSLSKKLHNRFLFFLRFLFTLILTEKVLLNNNQTQHIRGIKFVINGKLSGKPRASSKCVQYGSVPNQSLSKDVFFSSQHSYTITGAFGLKIWVHKE